MDANVFTYGSLMFEPVWKRVVRQRYASREARLDGYVRRKVRGEEYPAVVPAAGCAVTGLVYFNVNPADLQRLDRFEGRWYHRRRESLLINDGSRIRGWVYVFREAFRDRLQVEDWDPSEFSRRGLHRFLKRYPGFERSG